MNFLKRVHDPAGAWSGCEEGLTMRFRSRPLLDSEAAYTVMGVIGLGILPIVLAIAMLFFS